MLKKSVTDIRSVEKHLVELKGQALFDDEGLLWGDAHRQVTGIQVCWMATVPAIEAAVAQGANLIIAHEALLFPYRDRPKDHLSWPANRRRLELLAAHQISVIRLHSTIELGIFNTVARDLGLERLVEEREVFTRVYETEPRPIRQWIAHLKQVTGMAHLRVTPCDLDRPVRRVGLAWGGTALFVNAAFVQGLIDLQPDLIVAGESDCYGFLFALDAGIPLIETSHEVSENHGVQIFAEQLATQLDVPVTYHANARCWEVQ